MSRKDEIAADLMDILRKVYGINPLAQPSDKQTEVIQKMVDYLEENISLRRKKKGAEEKECLTS